MTTVEVFAPAKINLALHVTGQRDDGYHLLDSLVAFAHTGDTIVAEPAETLTLDIEGPFASDVPLTDDNLVLRAARLVCGGRGARLKLIKRLPVASGIGGGSADAAATVRALCELWAAPWPEASTLAQLGADVPVCLQSALTRMRGVGEELKLLGGTPEMALLLVNPGVMVPTSIVFEALQTKTNPEMTTPSPPYTGTQASFDLWVKWLGRQRNDLEAPAVSSFPIIGDVLEELRAMRGCRVARMSGSGATCFAIFDDDAFCCGGDIKARHPDWWVDETEYCPFYFAPSGTVCFAHSDAVS